MKELSIEQKAIAYDRAIEGIQEILNSGQDSIKMSRLKLRLQGIFPELKESDEKIKEALIELVKCNERSGYLVLNNVSTSSMIAWLEKQGEQEEILCDKCKKAQPSHSCQDITALGRCALETQSTKPIEFTVTYEAEVGNGNTKGLITEKFQLPKFKVGDWIIRSAEKFKKNACLIKEVKNHYICETSKGKRLPLTFNDVHKNFKLWDISDAKDGDVLATSEGAFIYNGNNGGVGCPGSYCGINTLGNFKTGAETHWTSKIVNPATKEQCDLLFKKMHEAGYEWDAENKKLNKIEPKDYRNIDPHFFKTID